MLIGVITGAFVRSPANAKGFNAVLLQIMPCMKELGQICTEHDVSDTKDDVVSVFVVYTGAVQDSALTLSSVYKTSSIQIYSHVAQTASVHSQSC